MAVVIFELPDLDIQYLYRQFDNFQHFQTERMDRCHQTEFGQMLLMFTPGECVRSTTPNAAFFASSLKKYRYLQLMEQHSLRTVCKQQISTYDLSG